MKGRTRVLAALLALFAFSASFAEQVWASTCAGATAPTGSAPRAAPAAHGDRGCDQEMPMPGSGHGEHSRAPAGGADCPFQAIAPGGCVLLSFPAPAAVLPDFSPTIHARVIPAAQAAPDLLLASPHFRPPQA
jgi:hypothetical protein